MVVATKGHIKDLPRKSYGVDFANSFEPEYEWLKGKKNLFSTILTKAKKSSSIYIASDPDREGEIIAKHCFDELGKLKKPMYRLRLKEITKEELKLQLQKKVGLDWQAVESQIARRVVDRIFGFEVSPDLWKRLKIPSLSAGRVQSTVLHWICEREKEIQNFSKETYFQLKLQGSFLGQKIELKYQSKEKLKENDIHSILNEIQIKPEPSRLETLKLSKIKTKKINRNPPKAFSTASLLESSFRTLKFDSKKTMRLAQSLFEGKKLNTGETVGLITYMRSDSTRVSDSKRKLGEDYLKTNYPNLVSEKKRDQSKQKKFSQDAHEAVIPINPHFTPDKIRSFLNTDEAKLYQLIWERFLVSLMKPETGEEVVFEFPIGNHLFVHSSETIFDSGFKQFPKPVEKRHREFPEAKVGDPFHYQTFSMEEKVTEPPTRYTQGKLIQKMEDTGVGRPSTYATILETLLKRKYIVEYQKNIGPSGLGLKVDAYLFLNFQEMIGESFTKELESQLDQITEEKESRVSLVTKFYEDLQKILKSPRKKIEEETQNSQAPSKTTNGTKQRILSETKEDQRQSFQAKQNPKDEKQSLSFNTSASQTCPKCKEGFVKTKLGKNGKTIYFCSRYPHCDYITYDN